MVRFKQIALIAFCFFSLSLMAQQASRMEAEYNRVKQLYETRDKNALKQLRNYLTHYPYTTFESELYFMMGVLQTERGQYKRAVKEFERADYQDLARPHQPQYQFYRGYAYLMQSDYQKASIYFSNLEKHETPYKNKACYYNAYCQYKLGNYDKAMPSLEQLENEPEYSKTVPYFIAQIYYANGEYDKVTAKAEKLIAEQPDNDNNAELHRMLGEIYYRQALYFNAVREFTAYDKAMAETKQSALRNDIYMLGMAYYRMQNYTQAIEVFKRVEKKEDEVSEEVSLALGNAYRQQGSIEQAKLAYLDASRYNLNDKVHYEAMYNYALAVYQSSSSIGESESVFTDFIRQYPNSEHVDEIYKLLSDAFRRVKNYGAALSALDSISQPDSTLLETKQYLRYQLGSDAFVRGKLPEAVDWFTAVITDATPSPVITDSYYWRAETEYRMNDYAACDRDLNSYFSRPDAAKSPNRVMADYLAGYSAFRQQNYDAARAAFERHIAAAQSSSPTYPDALNRIGDCYFNARNFAQAVDAYGKAAALGTIGSDYALFQQGYALGLMRKWDDKADVLQQLANRYPKSDYADDALYEIARVRFSQERETSAVEAYEMLLKRYPRSDKARTASLERAMAYRNMQDYDHAISAYKQTIERYPASREAYLAVEGLEAVCISANRVKDYVDYTKKLSKLNMEVATQDDSLAYAAAEIQLHKGNIDAALEQFAPLADRKGSAFAEPASVTSAQIYYERADYEKAMAFYRKSLQNASDRKHTLDARLGILRCAEQLEKPQDIIAVSSQILADLPVADDVKQEALFARGKAYFVTKQYGPAIPDLTPVSADVRTAEGAEAKYMLAQSYFNTGHIDLAEAQVMSFTQQPTQQQYWLARSLLVLAAVSHEQGDDFQARQYLLSLKANYTNNDDILQRVDELMATVTPAEPEEQPQQPEEEED